MRLILPSLLVVASGILPGSRVAGQDEEEELGEMAQFDLEELEGDERRKAIDALLKSIDDETVPVLCSVLRTDQDDDKTKERVYQALRDRGGAALFEPALELLQSPDQAAAGYGAALLGRTRLRKALEPLTEACRSPTPGVPLAAVRGLGDLGDPAALPALLAVRERATDLADEAALSLVRVGHAPALPWLFDTYEKSAEKLEEWSRMEEWASHHVAPQLFANEQARAAARKDLIQRIGVAFGRLPPDLASPFVQLARESPGKFLISFLAEQIPGLVRPENAHQFLGLLDLDSPPLVLILIETLDGLNDVAIRAAVDDRLRAFASDPLVQRRLLAIWTSCRFPGAERDRLILRALGDPSRWVRLEAAKQLSIRPISSTAQLLLARLDEEKDCQIRDVFRSALWRLSHNAQTP
ncbi:MAG: HEAT repeat domain-containing protein [Planctomycetes bacterium]|nr:HEAT repeat domain-containing protein [Planctomycetota bacterium]